MRKATSKIGYRPHRTSPGSKDNNFPRNGQEAMEGYGEMLRTWMKDAEKSGLQIVGRVREFRVVGSISGVVTLFYRPAPVSHLCLSIVFYNLVPRFTVQI
jgi:hypothetical protein